MKKALTIIALFISILGFSQTVIDKSSISSGGTSATIGTLSVVYSIGEVAINETTAGNIKVSEGFISSKMLTTLGVNNYSLLENIQIYPNPTVNIVNVNFEKSDTYTISIYNYSGKEIKTIKTTKTKQQISFDSYATGVYILLIKNSQKQVYKTFKLIKK